MDADIDLKRHAAEDLLALIAQLQAVVQEQHDRPSPSCSGG